jgi:hypothetical protein
MKPARTARESTSRSTAKVVQLEQAAAVEYGTESSDCVVPADSVYEHSENNVEGDASRVDDRCEEQPAAEPGLNRSVNKTGKNTKEQDCRAVLSVLIIDAHSTFERVAVTFSMRLRVAKTLMRAAPTAGFRSFLFAGPSRATSKPAITSPETARGY